MMETYFNHVYILRQEPGHHLPPQMQLSNFPFVLNPGSPN